MVRLHLHYLKIEFVYFSQKRKAIFVLSKSSSTIIAEENLALVIAT